MEELEIKSEPIHPIWYNSSETDPISGGKRWRNGVRSPVWRPPADVFETEQDVVVRVEVAGMREDDFSISLTGDRLSVRGNRPDVQEKRAYHQMEIPFGDFNLEVKLPAPVLADKVVAEYQAGFLRLVFPKDKPKRIQVND